MRACTNDESRGLFDSKREAVFERTYESLSVELTRICRNSIYESVTPSIFCAYSSSEGT